MRHLRPMRADTMRDTRNLPRKDAAMHRAIRIAIALTGISALIVASAGAPAADPAPEPLVERVRTALDKGVRFLRGQERQGSWERDPSHSAIAMAKPYGTTCLAVLALLNCGVRPDDPVVQRGLEY